MKSLSVFSFCLLLVALSQICLAGRRGGGGFGRKSGGGLGSWFGGSKKKTPSRNPPSSYPKQTWSQSGTGTNRGQPGYGTNYGQSNIGGGGFYGVNKQGSYGGSNIGGGGFANPGRSYGYYGSGGQSIFGSSSAGYSSYRRPFGGLSGSKGLAVGAGAGFIGGAVAGVAAMSMYHKYLQFKSLLYCHSQPGLCSGYGGYGYGGYGYGGRGILVNAEDCVGGCPNQAFCDYGVCRCRDGYEAKYGSCFKKIEDFQARQSDWEGRVKPNYNPYHGCSAHRDCRDVDMNMICESNKCACRKNMKWNDEVYECQIFIDVDCSSVDVNSTAPIPGVVDVADFHNDTLEYEYGHGNETESEDEEETAEEELLNDNVNVTSVSANMTLKDSLLTKINPNTTSEADMKVAFCREIARTAKIYAPPPVRVPVDDDGNNVGSGSIVVIVLVAVAVLGCAAYSLFKKKSHRGGAKPQDSTELENNPDYTGQPASTMVFSSLQQEPPPYSTTDQGGYPQIAVPYPPGPNAPNMQVPYPPGPNMPDMQVPYPQAPGAPYPPASGPGVPYPPGPGAPYQPGIAPYPPQTGVPYPPTA